MFFWKITGRKWYFKALNATGITNENGLGSLWNRLQQDTGMFPTQVVVTLNDETKLCCDSVQDFNDASVSLYETDDKGNVALYVTEQKLPSWDDFKAVDNVRHPSWGDNLTYIPSREIKYVELRYVSGGSYSLSSLRNRISLLRD